MTLENKGWSESKKWTIKDEEEINSQIYGNRVCQEGITGLELFQMVQ